ncbi:CHAT domain-containing protein [Streptomyces niger]|uniref:CHAT domain-containing protein n=1 Tax=Streptomyces niger TaxID=66373 RepID=UPI00069AD326|nr:CHAT domain-containing protein [Streptomyces niger]
MPGSTGHGPLDRLRRAALGSAPGRPGGASRHLRPPEGVRAGAPEPVALGTVQVAPEEQLPPGMALLKVQRDARADGTTGFTLEGHCGDSRLPHVPGDVRGRPWRIRLDAARLDGRSPGHILQDIRDWSANQRELVRWLNDLRHRYRHRLHLVIQDDTGFGIPWELLALGEDEDGPEADRAPWHDYLGGLVTMSRWTTIRHQRITLPTRPEHCTGRVLAYFAEDMRGDAAVFEGFARHPCEELTPFLAELERLDVDTGLAYMGCHGEGGPDADLSEFTLDVRRWSELNRRPMKALGARRTLVCLNACHSGHLVVNEGLGEQTALRGFPELFLRKGAPACIATTGAVGDDGVRRFLRDVIAHVAARPTVPVAQALRGFRAEAAAEAAELPYIPDTVRDDRTVDAEGQTKVLRFLYSFMFVYYGHPHTTLRLTGDAGREHDR